MVKHMLAKIERTKMQWLNHKWNKYAYIKAGLEAAPDGAAGTVDLGEYLLLIVRYIQTQLPRVESWREIISYHTHWLYISP